MLKNRFRKYLPVVVDIETGGFDPKKNAILEIAITLIEFENGNIIPGETIRHHIAPFQDSIIEKESLEFTKIKLDHPLRNAINEIEALDAFLSALVTSYASDLLPQFAAPTLRHLTNAPDAYALGHTEYLDFTL